MEALQKSPPAQVSHCLTSDETGEGRAPNSILQHGWRPLARFHNRRTWHRLLMPSNTQVLSTGMYCFVMILIASCATIPPVRAETL
jgi:hypothetical protein